jgi:predicted MFS family arabinose efflux permease
MYVTQELVKREYSLSDTKLGLLTGISYGLANGLAGLPIGWLIDRVIRKKLLATIVIGWSAMTGLCGVAGSYLQFFIARIGVGIAEAGGTPLSLSLVSDLYPPERRSSKVSWISSGYYLGSIVSFLAGGYLAASFGWRIVFLVYGVPGTLLGILIVGTMKEPARRDPSTMPPVAMREILRTIWQLLRQPGLRLLYLAVALTSANSVGVFSWWSSFMLRVHHIDMKGVGLIGTLATGVCGVIGMIAIGILADRARRRSLGGPLYLLSVASAISCGAAMLAIWTPSLTVMVCALCVAGGTATLYIGPGNAALSEVVPPHLRGLGFAIAVIITNLFGAALGPLLVGALSDLVARWYPATSLRVAMASVSLLQIPVAALYFRAARWRNLASSAAR